MTVSQTYSVAQYIADFDKLLAKDSRAFDKTTVDLVHALADYGHYEQTYLAGLHRWEIGSGHAEMPAYSEFTDDTRSAACEAAASHAPTANKNTAESHVESVSLSLDLLSSTTLELYAKTDGTKDVTSMTLADGTELELTNTLDREWGAKVPNIMAHNLSDVLNVTITTTGGTTATMNVSPCMFAYSSLNPGRTLDKQNAGAALMRYSQAADAYVEKYGNK